MREMYDKVIPASAVGIRPILDQVLLVVKVMLSALGFDLDCPRHRNNAQAKQRVTVITKEVRGRRSIRQVVFAFRLPSLMTLVQIPLQT